MPDLYQRNLKHIRRGMGSLQLRDETVPSVDAVAIPWKVEELRTLDVAKVVATRQQL